MLGVLAPLALFLVSGDTVAAEETETAPACLDISGELTLEGELSSGSVTLTRGTADGGSEEFEHRFLILTLPWQECFFDSDGVMHKFGRVHAYTELGDVEELMRRAEGKTVRLTGEAFPGHTRYHMAPLVLEVYGFATVDPEDLDDPLAH
ncbi:DUF4431 domain-containing protein [Parerythrobacter aestuarii]|uniref:DUF4431 domain-containing protein n=1 Tax=Parerythrobacter aestuarii TaxID=3020909 RepID=UPI0024DDFB8E|nr:DUF4431 domain-containing protein [Parerythrobacter aestuarii]